MTYSAKFPCNNWILCLQFCRKFIILIVVPPKIRFKPYPRNSGYHNRILQLVLIKKEAALKLTNLYRLAAMAFVFSWLSYLQSPQNNWAADLQINLNPTDDQVGGQIETIQVYQNGPNDWMTFGLYDTGASVVTISYWEQFFYYELLETPAIPSLPGSVATAQGIGGSLSGRVSEPGTVMADGLHALLIDELLNISYDPDSMAQVPGVQVFLGTDPGSTELPTITGTPIHASNKAAKIDMQGFELDFGEGLIFALPDLRFIANDSPDLILPGTPKTPTPLRIPLQLLGADNHADPGSEVTTMPNPVQNNVTLHQGEKVAGGKTFLFDTGAQVSIIDQTLAEYLELTQQPSIATIAVQGAAGISLEVSCYVLDALDLPRDDEGPSDGVIDGTLKLAQVPIFVLDMTEFGIDGILGMNLWNSVEQMVYDPTNPDNAYLSLTFSDTSIDQLTSAQMELLNALNSIPSATGGLLSNLTSLQFPYATSAEFVPEPSTWILLVIGITGLLFKGIKGRKP
jgi:hypothetical protein